MKYLNGISASVGVAKGKIVLYKKTEYTTDNYIDIDDAVLKAIEEIEKIKSRSIGTLSDEDLEIFEAYKMILSDKMFTDPIKKMIADGLDPLYAIKSHSEKISGIIGKSESEYMRERANDILYVGELLVNTVTDRNNQVLYKYNDNILVADELSPIDTMKLDKNKISGIVLKKGGVTSHTIIIAKSLGIPAIVGINDFSDNYEDEFAVIDATEGVLIIDPDDATKENYNKKIKKLTNELEEIKSFNGKKVKSIDGTEFNIYSNIGNFQDIKNNYDTILEGVGLFRTEFMYSEFENKPDINYQINEYKKVFDYFADGKVTIRTLDVGGDKGIKYITSDEEENPFLGNRGVRLYNSNEELIKEQIEAILRASDGKTVRLLVPMVSVVEEIVFFKGLVLDVVDKLREDNSFVEPKILIGIMVETPSSALNIEVFARYCDFFSVGTNDLTQYILSVDRGNENVSDLYSYCYPVVLKTIKKIIDQACKFNIPLSICGDIASDVNMVPLLAIMGLRNFSVPIPLVNRVKYIISQIDVNGNEQLINDVINCHTKKETEELILNFNRTIFDI